MSTKDMEDVLPFVSKPSSYLGGEVNSVIKAGSCDLRVALCFPDSYEIGMSHFGLQILYNLLNQRKRIKAERVFSPGTDMEARLRTLDRPAFSLETQQPLNEFDIIGFSLLYELNYTNVLALLDLSGIPIYASQRDVSCPLIIGGGPCTVNPEPVADFFDALLVGDGEEALLSMADVWLDCKDTGQLSDRQQLLERWSSITGVYIPSFFNVRYDENGFQRLVPEKQFYIGVSRAIVPELTRETFPEAPVVPFGRPVHDRLRLEIARGCSRGCRFCQAGMIYRPVRERPVDDVLALADSALAKTGYDNISFLSLSTGDYSNLNHLLSSFFQQHGANRVAVSIPSFRAGSINGAAMNSIKKVRKTGFTIAPEAGSQRLRDVINKNISETDIIETVATAFDLGWTGIKIYFMVGLPTETPEDMEQIVTLVWKLKKLWSKKSRQTKKGALPRINVSVATFIPKPHTPFQWEPQVSLKAAREKIFFLKDRLSSRQVGFKWQNPEMSVLEGVFARGDRRLSRVIEAAYKKGCRFDGWSDNFHYEKWLEAARDCSIDFDFYTTRQRVIGEPLPWDRIFAGVSSDFLITERKKAYNAHLTKDCREGKCLQCGVCDFKTIEPRLHKPDSASSHSEATEAPAEEGGVHGSPPIPGKKGQNQLVRYQFSYSKFGRARYFGHLEFINILLRAINRAGIPVAFSLGFHPKPKISFGASLPVGLESEGELFFLSTTRTIDPSETLVKLNRELPEGLTITSCRLSPAGKKVSSEALDRKVRYQLRLKDDPPFDSARLAAFAAANQFPVTVTGKSGRDKVLELKSLIARLQILEPRLLLLEIREGPGKTIRPREVAGAVFQIAEERLKQVRVMKCAEPFPGRKTGPKGVCPSFNE